MLNMSMITPHTPVHVHTPTSFLTKMIVDVLGCPSEQDLSFIQDKAARAVVLQQARQARGSTLQNGGKTELRPLSSYFPAGTSPLALDLLARMVRSRAVIVLEAGPVRPSPPPSPPHVIIRVACSMYICADCHVPARRLCWYLL